MIKTLTKHGNSYALVIDKPILELLGIDPDSPLELSTDGKVLTVTPATGPRREALLKKSMKEFNTRYAKALKKLAE